MLYDYEFDEDEEETYFLMDEDLEELRADLNVPDIVRIWSDGDDSRYSE